MKKIWKGIRIFLLIVAILFVAFIVIGVIGDDSGNVETSVNTPAVGTTQPEETEFTVEHDQKYLDTQNYIWEFLIDKGYEVQTIAGVPNIGKTDADLGEAYEGWYAFVKRDGEWKEFSVVLFNGEVSAIQPVKWVNDKRFTPTNQYASLESACKRVIMDCKNAKLYCRSEINA